MLTKEIIEKIREICGKYQQIKLLYIFGSVARGDEGPLSDYDFAVYLAEIDRQKRFDMKLELAGELSSLLKSDKVDVAVINDTDNINLKYEIISDGKLIYEKMPFKILVEPKIMNEFFDFRAFLDKFQKTK